MRLQFKAGKYITDNFVLREQYYMLLLTRRKFQQMDFCLEVQSRVDQGWSVDGTCADFTATHGLVDWRVGFIVDHQMYSPQTVFYIGDVAKWIAEAEACYMDYGEQTPTRPVSG